jgi:transcriptional repressor NrdR
VVADPKVLPKSSTVPSTVNVMTNGKTTQMGRRNVEGGDPMNCPYCRHSDSRVVDSRAAEDGTAIRRRRQCPECGKRFTTAETVTLTVLKRSGASEAFSRSKVISGVRKACQGRPVSDDDLALLAQDVEETVRAKGSAELASHEVGMAILGPLRSLDEIAYLRFASVYRAFTNLEDFEAEIALLRAERDLSANNVDGPTGSADEHEFRDLATASHGSTPPS